MPKKPRSWRKRKEKAAVLLQSAGLQLPGGLFRNSGFIHSIRESGSNVKPKIENVTQSQQFKRWFGDWEKNPNYNIGQIKRVPFPNLNAQRRGNDNAPSAIKNSSKNSIRQKDGNVKYSFKNNSEDLKKKQLEVILSRNPALNETSTWIRNTDDIKTLEETLLDSDWADYDEFNPDYTRDMAEEAIKTGKITVYSSSPIKEGIFVSPSRMEAESYSGNGKVYKKTVSLSDVAWIDPTQGQYAPVNSGETDDNAKLGGQNSGEKISVKTTETKEAIKDFKTARKSFIEYARDNFPKSVTNTETGKEIGISRKGLDKFLSGNITAEKLASGYEIPRLVETASKIGAAAVEYPRGRISLRRRRRESSNFIFFVCKIINRSSDGRQRVP